MIAPRTAPTMAPSFSPSSQPGILDEMTKTIAQKPNGKEDGGSRRRLVVKGHWKPSEDVKLRELVALHGPKNWNMISEQLPRRTGKSCRLRWVNQLDPLIKTTVFSREEDEMLMAAHMVFGNRWSHIAKFFPGRTDNGIKNHWHVLNARRRKHVADIGVSSSYSSGLFHRLSGDSDNDNSSSTITLMGKSTVINQVFIREEIKMPLEVAMETYSDMAEEGTTKRHDAHFSFTNPPKNSNSSIASSQLTATSTAITQPLPFIDFLGIGS